MSTASVTATAPRVLAGREEAVDRYQAIKQYSVAKILGVWAAAALPMGVLAWVVAPALEDNFSGAGNVPMLQVAGPALDGRHGVAVRPRRPARLARAAHAPLVDRPRRALASFATEPEDRPSRRQALADPDPALPAVRRRSSPSGLRRAGEPRLRDVRRLDRREGLLQRRVGLVRRRSSSCSSSTPCSGRSCSSEASSCRA